MNKDEIYSFNIDYYYKILIIIDSCHTDFLSIERKRERGERERTNNGDIENEIKKRRKKNKKKGKEDRLKNKRMRGIDFFDTSEMQPLATYHLFGLVLALSHG